MRPVLLLSLLLLACRGSTLSPAAVSTSLPAGDRVPASEYCERIAPIFCDFYVRCGRMDVPSVEACRPLFLQSCHAKFEPRYEMLEQARLVSLSTSGLEACRQSLTDVACERQPTELSGACSAIWTGSQPEGAACGPDLERLVCSPGTTCVSEGPGCGACRRHSRTGDPCDAALPCASADACVDGRCAPKRQPSDACDEANVCVGGATCEGGTCAVPRWVGANGSCGASVRCVYGTACLEGVCRKSARLGEACGARTQCVSGVCVEGTCRRKFETGAACQVPTDCLSGACVGHRCVTLPGACFPQ